MNDLGNRDYFLRIKVICITEGIPVRDMLEVRNKMKAKEEVLFEGGSFKIWWRDVLQFPDVHIEVSEITFEEGGLLLPQYADSDGISYVLEGKTYCY